MGEALGHDKDRRLHVYETPFSRLFTLFRLNYKDAFAIDVELHACLNRDCILILEAPYSMNRTITP